jgi:hypothetical protein
MFIMPYRLISQLKRILSKNSWFAVRLILNPGGKLLSGFFCVLRVFRFAGLSVLWLEVPHILHYTILHGLRPIKVKIVPCTTTLYGLRPSVITLFSALQHFMAYGLSTCSMLLTPSTLPKLLPIDYCLFPE